MSERWTMAEVLAPYEPCSDAVEWMGNGDPRTCWEECPHGEWLLWVAAMVGVCPRLVGRAACACARSVVEFLDTEDTRARAALSLAETWAHGTGPADAELECLHDEIYVGSKAHIPSRWAALSAANAAAWAAADHGIMGDLAGPVTREDQHGEAADAALAADYADDATVHATGLAKSATIVREVIPWPTVAKALGIDP